MRWSIEIATFAAFMRMSITKGMTNFKWKVGIEPQRKSWPANDANTREKNSEKRKSFALFAGGSVFLPVSGFLSTNRHHRCRLQIYPCYPRNPWFSHRRLQQARGSKLQPLMNTNKHEFRKTDSL